MTAINAFSELPIVVEIRVEKRPFQKSRERWVLVSLRAFGEPIADVVGPHPYAAFQQAFDPLLTEGARNYWKSHNFATLSDEAIDTAIDYTAMLPSPQFEIFLG